MRHTLHSSPFPLAAGIALALLGAAAPGAFAADVVVDPNADAPADQVIVPQVERRDVHKPHYPSNDFQVSISTGGYSDQNFGTSGTADARLAYHLNEDFFTELSYGQVKINDSAFRRILPGGVLEHQFERLQTYDLSLGYNLFSGEAFFGTNTAKAYQTYFTGGIGNTIFDGERARTFVYGIGSRLFLNDSFAVRVDARNHLYKFDLLGERTTSQNYELTLGASYFF